MANIRFIGVGIGARVLNFSDGWQAVIPRGRYSGPLCATSNPGPSWQAIGTGDFYGTGDSDILLQNSSSGQVAIWEMNGTNVIGGGTLSLDPGPSWQVVGTGDFNHNGHSDILLQNANGQAAIFDMKGTSVIGGGLAGPNPGASWFAI
jgi:hypothetical protein